MRAIKNEGVRVLLGGKRRKTGRIEEVFYLYNAS